MYRNRYDGMLEPWKLELITRRAQQRGLQGEDLLDIQQLLVLEVLKFQFDPAKSNGATETTALTALIDRQIAMRHRREQRYAERQQRLIAHYATTPAGQESLPSEEPSQEQHDLVLDVREAIEDLPAEAQRICQLLSSGHSVNQIAQQLGLTWRAVREQIVSLRRYFTYLGLELSGDPARSPEELA
ncbi:MAG: hypothetical protein ACKPEY_17105 [Planctomycetota bacterium]